MSADLTPRVIDSTDSERFDPDTGKLIRFTLITYRLGDLGPFREEFKTSEFTERELRARMEAKAAILKPFT